MAVDQSSGDVLVADAEAGSLKRYHADGTPSNFAALGSNAIGGFTFSGLVSWVQVAVDNSGGETDGNIYVAQGEGTAVKMFDEEGNSLGELTESSEGPLGTVSGVAVDPSGNLYVNDQSGNIHKYDPAGTIPAKADNSDNFPFTEGTTIAAGAGATDGFIFSTHSFGSTVKLDDSTGAEQYEVNPGGVVTTVSVNPASGHVFILEAEALKEFDASGPSSSSEVSSTTIPTFGRGIAVSGATGNVYVARNEFTKIEVFPFESAGPPPITHALDATTKGTGVGSVTCKRVGDTGFGYCGRPINEGSKVEIKATPAPGSTFTGFSGATGSATTCEAAPTTSPCVITNFETDSALALTFTRNLHTLAVTSFGLGAGTVECRFGFGKFGSCAGAIPEGKVEIRATPAPHSSFSGFGGGAGSASGCTTSPCTITLTVDSTLTATFTKVTHTLSVPLAGTGSGSVTCNGGACAASYDEGTSVTLAASANAGSTFAGFSGGGCSGTSCTVTMGTDTTVTATFNANPPAVRCKVPKMKGLALGKAKSALSKAHCKLGKVTKPQAKKGKTVGPLVVKSSTPREGSVQAENTKINLKLGPKPKKP